MKLKKKKIICFSSKCGLCSVHLQKINKCTKACKTEILAHPVTVKICIVLYRKMCETQDGICI